MNRQWLVARATESDPFLFTFLFVPLCFFTLLITTNMHHSPYRLENHFTKPRFQVRILPKTHVRSAKTGSNLFPRLDEYEDCASQYRDSRFESHLRHNRGKCTARLAQSVEHGTLNPRVVGSSPTLGASFCFRFCLLFLLCESHLSNDMRHLIEE